MSRSVGFGALGLGVLLGVASWLVGQFDLLGGDVVGLSTVVVVGKSLAALAVAVIVYGVYTLLVGSIQHRVENKRRAHDARNVVRFLFLIAGTIAVLGVLTNQWVTVLFSLGIVGFAITFALQQPLFSLLGWFYIMLKRPYGVGDRVKIEGAKGDVIDVDYLVTTLWEINGDLVSTNQPSGRIVTVPNSVVLSTEVYNYSWRSFPHIWNELSIQVAYETDLAFAQAVMVEEADDLLGEAMAEHVETYRDILSETPVELEVSDRPQVNVVQQESWIELRLRYLVHPRRGTRVRNQLYERILERFNEHPDRVAFPVSRNR